MKKNLYRKTLAAFFSVMAFCLLSACSSYDEAIDYLSDYIPALEKLSDSVETVDYAPRFWLAYTWKEISEDEARALWRTYNTSVPPTRKVDQYTQVWNDPIKHYPDRKIELTGGYTTNGDPTYVVTVRNMSMELNSYPVWDRTSSDEIRKIYQANEDAGLVRFEDVNYLGGQTQRVFYNGWCVEFRIGPVIPNHYDDVFVYQFK